MSILAIGWDVRGWRGNQQAVSAIKLDKHVKKIQWWVSEDFQFETAEPLSLSSLLTPAIGDDHKSVLDDVNQIVLGIDAPLAFSKAYIQLLTDDNSVYRPTSSQMSNPLAFRDCERWIKDEHSKTPLSASFDKLGNGATLAIALTHSLKKEGFSLVPQDRLKANRSIIEVYPGIVKVGPTRDMPAIQPVHKHIPDSIVPGTDQYDAAICALIAVIYAGYSEQLNLTDVVDIQDGFDPKEGWIYGLPASYVQRYQ